jgi:site-specific recombinase XerC
MTKQVPPLGKEDVMKAISGMGSTRIELRDKAVLWIATDSWCRASEIVAFRVKDLQRQSDGSSLLCVARSKTDQYYEGAFAYLSEKGTEAVLRWVAVRCAHLERRLQGNRTKSLLLKLSLY